MGEPERYEEHYGDGHEHTYHVHDESGQHIGTVQHYFHDEGFPNRIKYTHVVNGKVVHTNYGAPRDTNISEYGRDGHVNYATGSLKTQSRQQVANAVNAFHASPTGQKWLGRSYKLKEGSVMPRRKLDIIKEAIVEGTFSNKDKAEWHDSEANMLQGKSAALGEAKKEDEEPKTSSAEPKAHHWNNAKRAYGVPLTVKYQNIGGTAVDNNGNRVPRKELVRKHAFAAANAASKYSPEEKAAWRSKLITQRTAAKKAREATTESTDWENRGRFRVCKQGEFPGNFQYKDNKHHDTHDQAHAWVKKRGLKGFAIHDTGTGYIHDVDSGKILGQVKV
jgi:hypothetical protein